MNGSPQLLLNLAHVVVVLVVIAATTALAFQHQIPSDAVVGLLGAALGASGNAALAHRLPWSGGQDNE